MKRTTDNSMTTIDLPPLPPLTWSGSSWEGSDVLPSWAGFRDPATAPEEEANGEARVVVTTANPDGPEGAMTPTPEQVEAYRFLKEHERVIAQAVLADVFEMYPHEREQVLYDLDVPEGEENDVLPEISSPDGLKDLMGLRLVHVLEVAKDGAAYVGLVFGCAWEHEDGCGILLHRDRIVGGGFGETAFDHYCARADGGQPLGPPKTEPGA